MGFSISPNGKRLAFSWNPAGSWEIFQCSLPLCSQPLPLTSGPGGKFSPLYSPDGARLLYAVDTEGAEQFHLILRTLADGQETDLTPQGAGSLQPFFAWSPDGSQVAFISDRSGKFDVYCLPAQGGAPRLVFAAPYPACNLSWSPDGAWLAVETEAGGQDHAAFIVPLAGSPALPIASAGSPLNARHLAWSPCSARLAFSSNFSGDYQIGIYDIHSRKLEWLTTGKGQKRHPAWSPDGKSLAYVLSRGARSWLALHPLGEEPRLFEVEPGAHYHPLFTPDGRSLLFAFDNPRHPADLWLLSLADGSPQQLTHSLPEGLSPADFPMPEEITYPGMDGTPVPALLYRSPRPGPQPAVVVIHGGPDWHFDFLWYPLMAHLASRDWVILAPNYRGSTGYGRDWQLSSRFDYGGVDADDIAASAAFLARAGLADPKRIALTGRSHGGYLTASCLTRYPNLWAAGSAVVPFLNWFSNHSQDRPDLQHWTEENFGDPVQDFERWRERSPLFHLDRIQAPLQLICCRQDVRCQALDSIEAYNLLIAAGKPAELKIYEDEGHTFLKMENILDSELRRVAFLAQHLERT
ncbi:MAG: alpha/beta fold hydrolase [Anaerolineales bacterium]|nr:alpha/beta fold hydrolase [Anaerolineales bacterium]